METRNALTYILYSDVEKAIKKTRDKKATGDDKVPGDVLKLFGGGDLKLMTQLIRNINDTVECPMGFTEVTTIVFKKKLKLRNATAINQSSLNPQSLNHQSSAKRDASVKVWAIQKQERKLLPNGEFKWQFI
jgi:hypothetical protein